MSDEPDFDGDDKDNGVAALKSPSKSMAASDKSKSPSDPRNAKAPGYDLITLKIAIVGPKQSGKTFISNHLAGNGLDGGDDKYDPTAALRVLEFEKEIVARSKDGKQSMETKVLVELWDCSGDSKYEACWPAICKELTGVCIVFNPTSKTQASDSIAWTEWFVKNAELDSPQCILFAHSNLTTQIPNVAIKSGKKSISIPVVNVNTGGSDKSKPATSPVASAAGMGMGVGMSLGGDGSDRKPSSASLAFTRFLGDAFAFHKLADFQ